MRTNKLTCRKVTANFKKAELPVKHIVSGKTVKPSSTIANPKSLDFFYQFAKLDERGCIQDGGEPGKHDGSGLAKPKL